MVATSRQKSGVWTESILYPPEGGPIEYSFHFIGIGNGSRGFKNTSVNRPFWNLENVLYDGVLGGVGRGTKWVPEFSSYFVGI